MDTVTISIPPSLKAFVEQEVSTKGYGNVSEYFRTLLREAQARAEDERLQQLLLEGLASGDSKPVDSAFWKSMRTEAKRLLAAKSKRKGR